MNSIEKSCGTVLPTQRNCATPENSATNSATVPHQTGRKPATIQELRMQLQAQQGSNQGRNSNATEAGKVAPNFEVWGEYTPYVCTRTPTDWIVMIKELDRLIDRFCLTTRLPDEARAGIMATRCSQSLSSIPESLAWFRRELGSQHR